MTKDERQKTVKHVLVDMGISFRQWCRDNEISHSVAKDILSGRLTGKNSQQVRDVVNLMKKDFGENIFEEE